MSKTAAVQAVIAQVQLMNQSALQMNQAAAYRLGINTLDLQVVQLLRTAESPLTATDLARAVGISTAAATGLVDRLESAGYVRRTPDPHDRRRTRIELIHGRVGADLGPAFSPLLTQWSRTLAGYTEAELALVARVLGAMTTGIGGAVSALRTPAAP